MIRLPALACAILMCGTASADVLSDADGRWRGTGTGQDFDGVVRDIRCRLDVETVLTGRIDLRGTCAGVEGSQNFRLFLRADEAGAQVRGGGLTLAGDEAGPVLTGVRSDTDLTLEGMHEGSRIAITLRRDGDMMHMTSERERGGRIERSVVTYRRASPSGGG